MWKDLMFVIIIYIDVIIMAQSQLPTGHLLNYCCPFDILGLNKLSSELLTEHINLCDTET